MFDVLMRAACHPLDYSGVWRTTDLAFRERILEHEHLYSFIFTADALPRWQAGQHAIFTLPGRQVEGKWWRPFSVASAPHEGVIRIGTAIRPEPSSFKAALLALQPGDRVRMHGPFGELHLQPRMEWVVAVAGGIGITPFRSIIADLCKRQSRLPFHLIYSSPAAYTYQKELEAWRADLPQLSITYAKAAEETQAALFADAAAYGNAAHYLISGPPGMVASLRRELRSRRIRSSHILNDPFKGY